VVRLEAAVRIEALRSVGAAVVERVARPLGSPLTRLAFMPVIFTGTMSPAELWTLLSDGSVELQVPAERAPDTGFVTQYRVPAAALGRELALEVDGVVAAHTQIATGTGELKAEVPRGRHRVRLTGPSGLVAFAAAPPAAGGRAFRRQLVYELPPSRRLEFEISRADDELVSAFIEVVHETGPGTARVRYEIDPGKKVPPPARLYRRLTEPSGELAADAPDAERARLWEAESEESEPLPAAVARLRVVLGDDLVAGKHVLRLSAPPESGSSWVRVVIAGRRLASEGGSEEAP